jgi:serine/threonine protein kinase
MATGLAQLHETRGLLHCDVKPDNFLIGADGVVKVSDFGASRPQEEMHGRALENPKGTLLYIAPEINYAPALISALDDEIERLESRARQRGFTKEALSDLAQSRKLREEIDTTSIDSKADVFSLGLNLVHVFEGKTLADVGGVDKNLKPLATGSSDERNAVLSKLGITSDSPEHELIRAMLAGKPEDRPTTRQVLESPLFNEKGVGSEKTRKLLLAIAQGTLGTRQQ